MILGMSTAAFTALHVIISLIGIAAGLIVVLAMCNGRRVPGWTALFLSTTVLTSVTRFLFHSAAFGPPHVIGVISLRHPGHRDRRPVRQSSRWRRALALVGARSWRFI